MFNDLVSSIVSIVESEGERNANFLRIFSMDGTIVDSELIEGLEGGDMVSDEA